MTHTDLELLARGEALELGGGIGGAERFRIKNSWSIAGLSLLRIAHLVHALYYDWSDRYVHPGVCAGRPAPSDPTARWI